MSKKARIRIKRHDIPEGCYATYPAPIVLAATLLSFIIYASGSYILFQIHWTGLAVYLIFIIWMEYRLLRYSCRDCSYYGKRCAFGKGRIVRFFFKQGDTARFATRVTDWKSILPDILVSAIPFLAAVVLMIIDFTWPLLVAAILLLVMVTVGNGFVRGNLACKHCAQRMAGCPADKLFDRS